MKIETKFNIGDHVSFKDGSSKTFKNGIIKYISILQDESEHQTQSFKIIYKIAYPCPEYFVNIEEKYVFTIE